MIIPKEIREKIEQRIKLNEELEAWFMENTDIEGCDTQNAYIVAKPKGDGQGDGEYCYQRVMGEDWYKGQYYWEMDNGTFLCMNFEI